MILTSRNVILRGDHMIKNQLIKKCIEKKGIDKNLLPTKLGYLSQHLAKYFPEKESAGLSLMLNYAYFLMFHLTIS